MSEQYWLNVGSESKSVGYEETYRLCIDVKTAELDASQIKVLTDVYGLRMRRNGGFPELIKQVTRSEAESIGRFLDIEITVDE